MKNFVKYSVLSAGAFLLSAVPAFAATLDLTVEGNGADSENTVKVENTTTTVVSQTNTTSIKNDIDASASTGGNTVSGTTGGEVVVDTGDASNWVDVKNEAGNNVATVDSCGCGDDAIISDISENGAGTDNDIKVDSVDATLLVQDNTAHFDTDVDAKSKTGGNEVDGSTGGDVTVLTGAADVTVDVANAAGANTGAITGSGEGSSSMTAAIQMNGADSENKIEAEVDRSVALMQENKTSIKNWLDGYAKTGKNSVLGTTGGEVIIGTGDASVDISVKNQAGFNHAALDCGCLQYEASATIKKNGADSVNKIKAKLEANQTVSQVNTCGTKKPSRLSMLFMFGKNKSYGGDCFNNDLEGYAKTGYNEIAGSTQGGESDPAILTGASDVVISVENSAGSNTYPMYLE